MSHKVLMSLVSFFAIFNFVIGQTVNAYRSLSTDSAKKGTLVEVSINLTFPENPPAALILSEDLPEGLLCQRVTWNGREYTPDMIKERTLKWLFGGGGKKVEEGTLLYQARVMTDLSQKVFFAGSVQASAAAAGSVRGERILWINLEDFPAPEFAPTSGTVFEQELQISLSGKEAPGSALFLCFGEPDAWDDWQPYEGAFCIEHSQQLQAQTWLEDGRASLTSKAEYYRKGVCEVELQRGWNMLGISLEITPEECRELLKKQIFMTDNKRILAGGCGQAFWLFSEKPARLCLSGREPLQRGLHSACSSGWQAVALVGLEEAPELLSSEAFWSWEDGRYQVVRKLEPGKGYWRYQTP